MCDSRTDAQLAEASAQAPPGVGRVVTGRPFPDPDGFDLIGVSQSVLATDAVVSRARALGIPVISPMQLFLRLCPASIIGVTGSNGKSTTTALVGEMARHQGVPHIVAGNIGAPVLGLLGRLRPEATVILEISHTQLQYTDRSPALAAVTNVSSNLAGLRDAVIGRCRAVICFGEAGSSFAEALSPAVADLHRVSTLDQAVSLAATRAQAGDTVLLSPAGTSFDAYANFEVRGDAFRRAVQALDGFRAAPMY